MPCDHENPTLFGAERVICGTYKDEIGRTCVAPLKCHDTGDGLYALATERPPATHIAITDWHGFQVLAKPGIAYHLLSVTYMVSVDGSGPERSYPAGASFYVQATLNGVDTKLSQLGFKSDAKNLSYVVVDPLDFLLPENTGVYIEAMDGVTTLRYREVVVK